jgi:2'-5' RNA ligase
MEPIGKYSLWLMPPPAIRDRFAALIDMLSRRFGTPRFEPHITLAGIETTAADAIARTTALARQLPPVPVRLAHAGYTEQYFRCLFVCAERTDCLWSAHRAASSAYQQPAEADFLPHLSLVYGTIASAQKERALDDIGRRFDLNFSVIDVSLCQPTGTPDAWPRLGPFRLSGRS